MTFPFNYKNTSLILIFSIGLLFLSFSYLLLPDKLNDIRKNFGEYNKISINKRILSVTDNSIYLNNKLTTSILSCTFPNSNLVIPEAEQYDLIINKQVKLADNYKPADLILLSSLDIPCNGEIYLRSKVADSLQLIFNDLNTLGIKARINSGYRDFDTQQYAYSYWVRAVGKNQAETMAAPIGGSEHHLGTTIDIVTLENNYKLLPTYTHTKLHIYLTENAYKYGFVMSYPEGKEAITGFSYEPWHYRYVGKTVAKFIKDNNITLTQYLYNINNYCLLAY